MSYNSKTVEFFKTFFFIKIYKFYTNLKNRKTNSKKNILTKKVKKCTA